MKCMLNLGNEACKKVKKRKKDKKEKNNEAR
jgi:hypothetical protein